ncbi:MAG: DNA translocase FtsK 4TM domain-containing protein [Gammaproteobacteria bacterium]|nr:DNA translocase FtsK 4TM domain-containing protein [Gammaproteobacteria bacterium]
MAQATRKNAKTTAAAETHHHHGLREGALFVLGAIAIYLLLSLATYSNDDPGVSYSPINPDRVANAGGFVGAWLASALLHGFGYFAYLFPILIAYGGWLLYRGLPDRDSPFAMRSYILTGIGFVLTILAGDGIATLHFGSAQEAYPTDSGPGGILGSVLSGSLIAPFSFIGTTLFLLALFMTGITLATGLSWFALMDRLGAAAMGVAGRLQDYIAERREENTVRQLRLHRSEAVKEEQELKKTRVPPRIEPVIKQIEISERVEKERQVPLFTAPANGELPPLSLLDPAEPSQHALSTATLEAMSRQVEMKLQDFGIEAQVVAVNPGPVITRFELQPAPGVKVSQISNLSKDLARALSTVSVRIVDVIPGKSVIGLEIPNEHREIVRLSEILQSKQYDEAASPLSLGLGKDISGNPVVVDLARMPHLLIAGTTGSGKSVAVNAMILSMLYNASPSEMRMIMIDPKMLELSIYEGIPHLLAPVVTDMKEASSALRWCVGEMDRRYALMAHLGVRNIANYNRKVAAAIEENQPLPDPFAKVPEGQPPATLQPIPYIVVMIDELADMMMVVGKKVEQLIARLAQKARASGIHLVLATQRPSVDVITGLIKANIPTRIAFQVSSKIDSRTILDQMGAESLLGHGDMLYLPPGTSVPTRVHGAFVDDHEVHKVVDFLKKSGEPEYLDELLRTADADGEGGNGYGDEDSGETDALYDQAVRIVTETRKASISGVQRRLKIGYNRAARMVEEMEKAGIVGPLESNGSREVIAPPPPAD